MDLKEQNEIIKGLLYQDSLDKEQEWRAKPENYADAALLDKMLVEINELGFGFCYLTDIRQLLITHAGIATVIIKYLGEFDDPFVTSGLVLSIGYKKNKYATEKIIEVFNSQKPRHRAEWKRTSVSYDNALNRLKDKRYINEYLRWLSDPEIAVEMPFSMQMLARWKNPEARKMFMQYLDSDEQGQIKYTSLKALSIYDDLEAREKIVAICESPDEKLSGYAKSLVKRFK